MLGRRPPCLEAEGQTIGEKEAGKFVTHNRHSSKGEMKHGSDVEALNLKQNQLQAWKRRKQTLSKERNKNEEPPRGAGASMWTSWRYMEIWSAEAPESSRVLSADV